MREQSVHPMSLPYFTDKETDSQELTDLSGVIPNRYRGRRRAHAQVAELSGS